MATIVGTNGNDHLQGGSAADMIDGLAGDDVIFGNDGDDELHGGDGVDWLFGGFDNDALYGGDGADRLLDQFGVNRLYGGGGDDEFNTVGAAGGYVDGGDGTDYLLFSANDHGSAITFSLADPATAQSVAGATIVNIERVNFGGTRFADTITGGALDDQLGGGDGDDVLDGAGGNDRLFGGHGRDTLHGGDGDDYFQFDTSDLLLDGGAGVDLLDVDLVGGGAPLVLDLSDPSADQNFLGVTLRGIERLDYFGANGSDTVTAGAYEDIIAGNGGDDVIDGGGGDDVVHGNHGVDELRGGAGDDVVNDGDESADRLGFSLLDGGEGTDLLELILTAYTGAVTIDLADSSGSVRNFEQISFRGWNGVNTISGGELYDLIWGGSSADHFEGRGGDDDLRGNGGNDVIDGGAGNDLILGGQGADQLHGGDGDDTIHAGSEGSLLDGGDGDDVLTGSGFGDTLIGGAGSDGLDGQGGADSMAGGTGDDGYFVDNVGDTVTENPDEGTDRVFTGLAAYSLLGTNVENLTATSSIAHDFRGSTAHNSITGGAGNDLLRLNDGGDDRAFGGGGNDVLYFGAAFTGADVASGGTGRDVLILQGDYNLILSATNFSGLESLSLQSGSNARWGDTANNFYDYDITTVDANVPAGVQMIVNGQSLRAGEDFTFDGSAESDGRFLVYAGHGVDTLTGGAGSDVFFFEGTRWSEDDTVDGGGGRDAVIISSGTGVNHFEFGESSFTSIESISVNARFASDPSQKPSYELVLANGNVTPGGSLIVNGSSLADPGQFVSVDGSAVTGGSLLLFGGAGDDSFIGGAGADLLHGAGGSDRLVGGAGADIFRYDSTADSATGARDLIFDFAPGSDRIDLSRIDANSLAAGDQAFNWIGSNAFSGTGAGSAGELRGGMSGGWWVFEGDVNGDGAADFAIQVMPSTFPYTPSAGDFIL